MALIHLRPCLNLTLLLQLKLLQLLLKNFLSVLHDYITKHVFVLVVEPLGRCFATLLQLCLSLLDFILELLNHHAVVDVGYILGFGQLEKL